MIVTAFLDDGSVRTLDAPRSLEDTERYETLSKRQIYVALTGEECFGETLGDTHPLKVEPEQMELAYRAVCKMRERYNDTENPTDRYYAECFERLDRSFASGDFKDFKEDLEYLLISVACE